MPVAGLFCLINRLKPVWKIFWDRICAVGWRHLSPSGRDEVYRVRGLNALF